MINIKNKTFLIFILLWSIFALLFAYFVQYVLGHQPCNLCLIERIPYMITIVIIVFFLYVKKFEKILILTICIIFILLTLISLYHFGIEQGFIDESFVCELNSDINNLTKEAVLEQLSSRFISCKDVTFEILGLSLATINIVISLILSIITLRLFINYEKK
ncbi:disulfide bond formation protein B [Candidatus Pelagibacter sp.]|nr:disulfide bond formation protein B [Candidatus Pelagibacter sp.]